MMKNQVEELEADNERLKRAYFVQGRELGRAIAFIERQSGAKYDGKGVFIKQQGYDCKGFEVQYDGSFRVIYNLKKG